MKTLRQLAREYARGQLTQADYRQHRNELIQNILSGKTEISDHTFDAPLLPLEEDTTEQSFDPFATTQLAATVPQRKRQEMDNEATLPDSVANSSQTAKPQPVITSPIQRNKLTILFTATVIVLVIAIALTFYMLQSKMEPTVTVAISPEQQNTPVPASDRLIQDFLSTNNWQEQSLNQFLISWQQLKKEEQNQALQSTRINQLGSAIYKKILEEKALIAIGDTESALSKQQSLIDFAHAIGINDPRITP